MLTMIAMGTYITPAMNIGANKWIPNLGTLSFSPKKAYSRTKLEQLVDSNWQVGSPYTIQYAV